jgi:hypothetical protein
MDALHQSGVDPTAEAPIRAGDAQRGILFGPGRNGNDLPGDRCAYRLCHPNVVPMETAEPSD